ncbi:hypothetical protein COE15_19285 [Bacillus cereus]|uniref:hypothetical protein n=1 Tax=Bacillus sp. AFS023182 TaxID=2033492 RepID=UPI000BF89479|nr:hypothetical protein [Bacillus sp. AFS023182]PFE06348.1 hypothetical protein CN288_00855 [Bacillus sp. AFS023182]PGX96532.1 hypothetical protein COE15_19285 [Bacillus cereus]
MTDIVNLALYSILFIIIISIICLILSVFMKLSRKKTNHRRSIEKERKVHSPAKDTGQYKDSEITTKDAEAEWMNAVMTTSFVVAAMKSAHEDSNIDHDLGNDSHGSDSASHNDSFDGGDSSD